MGINRLYRGFYDLNWQESSRQKDIDIVKEKDVYLSIKGNNLLLPEAVNMVEQ